MDIKNKLNFSLQQKGFTNLLSEETMHRKKPSNYLFRGQVNVTNFMLIVGQIISCDFLTIRSSTTFSKRAKSVNSKAINVIAEVIT